MTYNDVGMTNVRLGDSKVTIGDGKSLTASKIGDLKVLLQTKEGWCTFTLKDVKHVPNLCINLLSIPKALNEGYNIGNNGSKLFLTKGDFILPFDKLFKAGSSFVCGVDLHPWTPDYATPALENGAKIKFQDAHNKLGHCGEDSTRSTAKYYG